LAKGDEPLPMNGTRRRVSPRGVSQGLRDVCGPGFPEELAGSRGSVLNIVHRRSWRAPARGGRQRQPRATAAARRRSRGGCGLSVFFGWGGVFFLVFGGRGAAGGQGAGASGSSFGRKLSAMGDHRAGRRVGRRELAHQGDLRDSDQYVVSGERLHPSGCATRLSHRRRGGGGCVGSFFGGGFFFLFFFGGGFFCAPAARAQAVLVSADRRRYARGCPAPM